MGATGGGIKDQQHQLMGILGKIPIFADLNERYKRLILSISKRINIKQGSVLCFEGDVSDYMYILLFGKLSVSIKGSGTIATINPIGTIGEMGVFTDEKRSASVKAMTDCALMVIRAEEINRLLEKEPAFGNKIMRKVIKIMAERIQEHNAKIREFQNYIMSLEKEKK